MVALAFVLAACAAQQPARSRIVWQKLDGTAPTRGELDAAAAACKAVAGPSGGDSGRFATQAWAAKALECMREKGFERVEMALPPPQEEGE